jgi:hypothetical protein
MLEKLTKTKVRAMTEDEICELLAANFDINVDADDCTKAQLVDMYMEQQKAHLDNEADDAPEESGADEPKQNDSGDEFVQIRIAGQKGEPKEVALSLNGRAFVIRRNEWVTVPKTLVEILDNAESDLAKDDSYEEIERRFNFSVKPV